MTNKERVELLKKINDELLSSKDKDYQWVVAPQYHLQQPQISLFQSGSRVTDDDGNEEIAAVEFDLEGNLVEAHSTLSQAFIDEATEYAKFWLAIDDIDTANQDR